MTEREPVRVLLIDDDPAEAIIFKRRSAACSDYDYETDHVTTLERAAEALAGEEYDLIVADVRMSGAVVGRELVERLIQAGGGAPVIAFTGIEDKKEAVELMKTGASDFLFKDGFDAEALERCTRHALERRRAGEALARVERERAAVLDGMSELVFYHSPERTILWANKAACECLGLPQERIVGRSCRQVWRTSGEPCPDCPVERAFQTGQAQTAEMTSPDGRSWLASADPIRGPDGGLQGVVEVSLDITDRTRADEALRQSEAQYRTTLDAMGDPIHLVGPDLRVLLSNTALQAWCLELGLEPDPTGRRLLDAYPFLEGRVADEYRLVFETGQVLATQEKTVLDGRELITEVRKIPVVEHGEVVRVATVIRNVTEQREAEAALRESEKRYRALVDQSLQGLFIARGFPPRVTYANPAAAAIVGRSPEEVVELGADAATRMVHPEDRATLLRLYSDLMAGARDEVRHVFRLVRQDGSVRWVEFLASPAVYGGSKAVQVAMVDITERRLAEEALRESEEQYRQLVEQSLQGIFILCDSPFRIAFANRAAAEMVGATVEELLAWSPRQVAAHIHPDDFDLVAERYQARTNAVAQPQRYEFRVIRPDGAVRWLETFSSAITYRGEPAVQAAVMDVTERRAAAEELRTAEHEKAIILNGLAELVVYHSPACRIVWANRAAAESLGRQSADLIGQSCHELWHGRDEPCAECPVVAAAKTGRIAASEITGPDGRVWQIRGEPILGADGAVEGVVEIAMDITEHKEAEQRVVLRAERLSRQIEERFSMVGESPAMQKVYELIDRIAPTDAGVLICGESGTGKEMVARAIHRHSARSEGPLETVNCAAMAPTLLESELFGHVRGAFTGAVADKAGRFELADSGTLFLDEVLELPVECEAKLLRALEEGKIRRVGDTRDHSVDVRLIAATNRRPDRAMREGRLREDLFFRLDRLRVLVPPLRERADDIALLAEFFLRAASEAVKRPVDGFTPEALSIFTRYDWPGNVRELKNVVERMVILGEGPLLGAELIPEDILAAVDGPEAPIQPLSEVVRRHVLAAMDAAGGNKTRAAEMLGIDRSTLYARLRDYDLHP